jgi:cytochrome c5
VTADDRDEYEKTCDTCHEELVTDDPMILRHEHCDW